MKCLCFDPENNPNEQCWSPDNPDALYLFEHGPKNARETRVYCGRHLHWSLLFRMTRGGFPFVITEAPVRGTTEANK